MGTPSGESWPRKTTNTLIHNVTYTTSPVVGTLYRITTKVESAVARTTPVDTGVGGTLGKGDTCEVSVRTGVQGTGSAGVVHPSALSS